MNIKRKEYLKLYRINNKEKIKDYGKNYRKREDVIKRVKKWRLEHKDYLSECSKIWRDENKQRKKTNDRNYFLNNRDKVNKSHNDYKKINKERVKNWYNKYNNSEKGRLNFTKQNHLRMSKKYGNEFKLTTKEIREILNRDKNCVYCGSIINLQLDHIIPLKKGGKSKFNNYVLCCKNCNQSKGSKDVLNWCKSKKIQIPNIINEGINN